MRIRWEDVNVRVYVDGSELGVYAATSLSFDETLEVDEAKYQGMSQPSLDGHYRGGRGSIDFRLDDSFADPWAAYLEHRQGIKERTNEGRIRIVASRRKPGLQDRETRRFDNCIVNIGERGSENNANVVTWSFQYENMELI